VDNGNIGKSEACAHRPGSEAFWVRNDGIGAPVILLSPSAVPGESLITLTNQKLYIRCPRCFEAIRSGLTR